MQFNSSFQSKEYQRYFVNLQNLYKRKEIKVYTNLILSLFAVTLFVYFALRPTAITIAALFRELEDKKTINQKLQEKINSLDQARINYSKITNSLYLLDQALPKDSDVNLLLVQIEILAQKSNVAFKGMNFEPVNILGEDTSKKANKKNKIGTNEIVFNLDVTGDYESLKSFLKNLEGLRRLINIQSFSITQSQKEGEEKVMSITISTKSFFTDNIQ